MHSFSSRREAKAVRSAARFATAAQDGRTPASVHAADSRGLKRPREERTSGKVGGKKAR